MRHSTRFDGARGTKKSEPRASGLARACSLVVLAAVASGLGQSACKGTEAPEGPWPARETGGPVVLFDLFARPLPEVPLPTDLATRPDRTSPTGRRVNASMIAPTELESDIRRQLDRLDGWATYGTITFSLEPLDQLLDMGNVLRRHTADNFRFADDAIYLINVDPRSARFGQPVPIDLGEGNFPPNLQETDRYFDNDPRSLTSSLLFDTTYEDTNGNGRLDICEDANRNGIADPGEDLDGDGEVFSAERDLNGNGVLDPEEDLNGNGRLDCSEDTDFDGHLDVPNLYCGEDERGRRVPPWECPDVTVSTPNGDVVLPAADAWLQYWYEMESNTVILRPVIPLEERTVYAVVLTSRLVDEQGRAVRSPFPTAGHPDQAAALRPLASILADNAETYGGLGERDIQFAWTFTTQSVTSEIRDIREGLYGRGPLGGLARDFPPDLRVDLLHECESGVACELPPNRHIAYLHATEHGPGLLEALEILADEAWGMNPDEFEPLMDTFDYVDYIMSVRFDAPNFLDNDGRSEDLDGDGRLDLVDEDVNGNGVLDPGEDIDIDGHLDVNEDVNGNHVLDGEEGVFDLDIGQGRAPHARHQVTALITVPRPDPARGIVPPYPVVFYGHGYTSARIEALGFAGSLAKFGFATIGVDCVHHGLELDDLQHELVRATLAREDLVGLHRALLYDRSRDLNNDGVPDPGGDFWTAYVFHTRDVVRQSGIDHLRMIQILRSFDGLRRSELDLDGDGEPDLAGDFDGDGVVDFGGPEADYHVMGSSLGGIMAAFLAGLEPAIVAAAPIAGGGGLGDVGIRSRQGGVKEAVILRMMGPLLVTNPAEGYVRTIGCSAEGDCPGGSCVDGVCRCTADRDCVGGASGYRCGEAPESWASTENVCQRADRTSCSMNQLSARFIIPDLNHTGEVEYACLERDDLREGDTVVVRNLVNEEVGCFVAWPGGRSRVHLPSDLEDRVELTVYAGEVLVDGATCTVREGAAIRRVLDSFEVDAEFQYLSWVAGEPLVTPAEGFGLRRATPAIRRFMGIAQMVLEPGEPANMATHYFEDPVDYGAETAPANVMVVATVGDMNVPVNTGIAIARAAGILDITRPDPRLADAEHPEGRTPNRFLVETGVIQGLERLSPYRRAGDGLDILFDADDLDRSASPPAAGWVGDGFDAPSSETPFRVWRRRVAEDTCTCLDASGEHPCGWPGETVGPLEMVRCPQGVSLLALPYIDPHGAHGFVQPEPHLQFDINTFMINMIGHYFRTGGTEVRWGLCMEDNSCTEGEDGYYVPPVPAVD